MNVKTRKAQLEALSQLARTEAEMAHFALFNEQIRAEKNDRGAAILAATNVEHALRYALARRLTVKKTQYRVLFGMGSPLGTFDQKIQMAYAFTGVRLICE